MTKVILGPELREKFNGLNDQLEICDESGKTLGHFLPEGLYREMVNAYLDNLFPKEELDEARKQTTGRTLPEIWRRLGITSEGL